MRALLLASLVVVTAACGAYQFPHSSTAGTVSGHVTAVPCSPVEKADQPCKPFPAIGVEIDFTSASGALVQAKTDQDGAYTASLDAGTWSTTVKTARVIAGPKTVTVRAGATSVADFVVDSGIRVPVAAA